MTSPTDTQVSTKLDTGFETTGIERVEEHERAHTQLLDTMWLWWSANAVVATVALGSLSAFFGLSFWGNLGVIVVFNILGTLPVAFLSTLGPKTGLAQMPLSRFSFGLQGAKLPALFNAVACIGWSAVNAIIGANLLVAWSAGKIPAWAGLLILAALTTVVSVFGYFIVHRYERYAWIPMFLLFAYVFFVAAPHFNVAIPTSVTGLALFASVMTFGGAIFGFAIGWTSYAADYTRRQPATTSASKVFTYAMLGVTIPCIVLETLGALLATSFKELPDAGTLIAGNLGGGIVASIVVLLLAFSTIANNVPNDYSFALSMQVLGVNIHRWVLTLVGAVIYILLALALQANFNLNLEGFLLLIAYWLGGYSIILFLEDRFRKGNYPAQEYTNAAKLPAGWAAVVAMIVGLAVAALGINQAATIGYEGILSKSLADADIGFPLAVIATGVLYYILRKMEMARAGR